MALFGFNPGIPPLGVAKNQAAINKSARNQLQQDLRFNQSVNNDIPAPRIMYDAFGSSSPYGAIPAYYGQQKPEFNFPDYSNQAIIGENAEIPDYFNSNRLRPRAFMAKGII